MTEPDQSEPFALAAVLAHNPTVHRALAAEIAGVEHITSWLDLGEALGGGVAQRIVEGFLGNKSERVMLAALLMKADHAGAAVQASPNFWVAWGGLDRRNRLLFLDLLEEDLALG